ncbi:GAD-like domain-containing protein [Pseudomonas faucium]|uniref:GAD-like domain-containing protein n=1 Tax=Pseudomonas faucium TaxID=2740518 RepID=UPI001F2EE416|nr:GAD-like domain-containing protein [Pseudomonas faucium]
MDEIFTLFIEEMGAPLSRKEVPPSSIERYRDKLPEKLLEYWREHGWCGYGDGIFWTVNPQDYEGVVNSFIENTALKGRDTYHVIARGAFGDLYLYGEHSGFSVSIVPYTSNYSGRNSTPVALDHKKAVEGFFLLMDQESNDFGDLFEPAKNKLGRLEYDEIYGFVPALAIGGMIKLENIERVKAVEHLIFLSQLSPLEPYAFSDF